MLQPTKRQVELFEMHFFTMFITGFCGTFLVKLRWPKNKSIRYSKIDRFSQKRRKKQNNLRIQSFENVVIETINFINMLSP